MLLRQLGPQGGVRDPFDGVFQLLQALLGYARLFVGTLPSAQRGVLVGNGLFLGLDGTRRRDLSLDSEVICFMASLQCEVRAEPGDHHNCTHQHDGRALSTLPLERAHSVVLCLGALPFRLKEVRPGIVDQRPFGI